MPNRRLKPYRRERGRTIPKQGEPLPQPLFPPIGGNSPQRRCGTISYCFMRRGGEDLLGNNSEFFNRSSDRTRIAGGFRNAVAQHRSCWCFMSVYWIWTLLALQGVTLLPPVMLVGQSVPLWLLPVCAMAASSV